LRPGQLFPLRGLVLVGVCLTFTLAGCKDLTGSPGLPAGTPDPSTYNTPAGAIEMRNAAVFEFEQALPQYVVDAGLLTDELEDPNTGAVAASQGVSDPLDERILPEGTSGGIHDYQNFQGVREFANQAIGALATYDTAAANRDSAAVLRGELYALEGYTEIMLADLFCSGVPLSTLDFQKDFTYAPSSTTTQVYYAALAKFDTALTVAAASDNVVNLARVGRGRAWLDLGQVVPGAYDSAAAAVAAVPEGFQKTYSIDWIYSFGSQTSEPSDVLNSVATVSDREGVNGLPFLSSGDPRSAVDTVATQFETPNNVFVELTVPLTFPVKYSTALSSNSYASFTVADWIEARLIQAEAAWHGVATGQGSWLDQLNALRTNAISPELPQLADPGTPAAQVQLLFQERAYWLFLTGHRQGDLRRLLRQYGQYSAFRSQQQVYPAGPYLAPGAGVYGTDVTVPIPTQEYANPDYHGCLDRKP
jgi:hypothetical protein